MSRNRMSSNDPCLVDLHPPGDDARVLFVVVASRQGRSERVPPGDGRIGVLKGDRGQPSCPRKNKGRPPTPSGNLPEDLLAKACYHLLAGDVVGASELTGTRETHPFVAAPTRGAAKEGATPPLDPPYLKVARFACSKIDCNRMDAPRATKRPGARFPGSRLERLFRPRPWRPRAVPIRDRAIRSQVSVLI